MPDGSVSLCLCESIVVEVLANLQSSKVRRSATHGVHLCTLAIVEAAFLEDVRKGTAVADYVNDYAATTFVIDAM